MQHIKAFPASSSSFLMVGGVCVIVRFDTIHTQEITTMLLLTAKGKKTVKGEKSEPDILHVVLWTFIYLQES